MENEYLEVLSPFLQTFLGIVLPVLATFLAGLAVQGIRWLQAKIKSEQPQAYEILSFLADAAVKSAEQAQLGGLIENKKLYAIDYVEKWLVKYGLTIDVGLIESEIEKAVFESINQPEKLLG